MGIKFELSQRKWINVNKQLEHSLSKQCFGQSEDGLLVLVLVKFGCDDELTIRNLSCGKNCFSVRQWSVICSDASWLNTTWKWNGIQTKCYVHATQTSTQMLTQ